MHKNGNTHTRTSTFCTLSKTFKKNAKNPLQLLLTSYIIANVVTLIALKREVAVEAKAFAGFPWSECQVVKTGDKSLYEYTIY